ncbi:MAG: hypothetical protein K2Y27_14980 [Xanthobacteraceae bacterium]|nr:hypothetical protein [Xanthobacteraceae bacterium]
MSTVTANRRTVKVGDAPHHGKMMDLLMLTVTGGMERTVDQFESLVAAAGFKFMRVIPTATHQSIVEAAPAQERDFAV